MSLVMRSTANPIIRPEDVSPSRADYEVICVFNAGVTRLADETILLLRVAERPRYSNPEVCFIPIFDPLSGELVIKELSRNNPGYDFSDSRVVCTPEGNYLTSISHFRVARSKDGIHFDIAKEPSMFPQNHYETYGIEDPRITLIDGVYAITYTAVSPLGVTCCLAETKDFQVFVRRGVVFHATNKDVEIFPERIQGKYYALHRPSPNFLGMPDIWLAESPDLVCWGNHRHLISRREGFWDNRHVGGSAVPFRTSRGWLEIYHGVDQENRYSLGALLLDLDEPWRVLSRSRKPILSPEAPYETEGFFGNVIFTCGVLPEGDTIKIYYGAADTYLCYAEVPLLEIFDSLE